MKKIYLIQYKQPSNASLDNRIKSLGSWARYFDENWIVESELSASEIYKQLSVGLEGESIFIIQLDKSNWYGRMNTSLWDYLKEKKRS